MKQSDVGDVRKQATLIKHWLEEMQPQPQLHHKKTTSGSGAGTSSSASSSTAASSAAFYSASNPPPSSNTADLHPASLHGV